MRTALENRVRRLERANRVLSPSVLAVVALFLVGSSSQSGGEDTLRSKRFELVNADGTVSAFMGRDAEGSTGLFIA